MEMFSLDVVALLLHGATLGLLLLVHGEADLLAGVDVEPLLEHLADAEYGVRLGGVGQPHRQLVRLPTHVHHRTVHLHEGGERC
jgi:hypothetical protein